ncbi:hypothetical protein P5G62_023725 [Neobacillus sp. 179-C4.2 HS]|uniref:Uncharacterized protein n=1 Tax=Neobacillus driksii TaxID=3035913 RepID=A0ABV4YZ47_9BACI|nr:hypothetical protein [Neobacillus sp. 179.-C4.2 HS]MDP5194705.1 hypothetical protein [Neobacillus sp. 179.-C4.2 HS]
MNTITKGAIAMVLAGSVTFSVAHTLLGDQSTIRLAEENAATISGDPKKADIINQAEKEVKNQTPASKGKDGEMAALNVASNNSDMNVATIQQNSSSKNNPTNPSDRNKIITVTSAETTVTSTKEPTITLTTPTTSGTNTTRVSTKPETTKPASTPTTTAPPTKTETNATSTSSTDTNRGRQVSQAAKEKAENRRGLKENNGKNM